MVGGGTMFPWTGFLVYDQDQTWALGSHGLSRGEMRKVKSLSAPSIPLCSSVFHSIYFISI